MGKVLKFQSTLSCSLDGQRRTFESNIVEIKVEDVYVINQRSLPISLREIPLPARVERERCSCSIIQILLLILLCKK